MDCSIGMDGSYLTGHITEMPETRAYAFYVHKHDAIIHIQKYSTNNTLLFDTKAEPGLYYLSCFTMDADNNRNMAKTGFKFFHGPLIDLEEVSDEQLGNSALTPFYVRVGDQNFHCLFSRGDTERLFVLLTAAISRKAGVTNHFNRMNSRPSFKGHCLYISDPTLAAFPELDLGWYLGDSEHDATKDMAQLVSKVARHLGLDNTKIIPYGSSGGGFAAMALANLLPGSCAVANNPQANALNFIPSTVNAVLTHCFGGMNRHEVESKYRERIDMPYALRNTESRILLVQNTLDRTHWKPHYLPLAESLSLPSTSGPSLNNRHHAVIYNDERGHVAAPPAIFHEIMNVLTNRFGI